MWKDVSLLSISQLTVGKYGRKVGSLLWSEDEIIGHMISPQRKNRGEHCRPPFDNERKLVWES